MPALVECRSDCQYAERPTAVVWEGQRLVIDKTLEASLTPEGKRFRVRTTDGKIFGLIYSELHDEWKIDLL
ncbi:MAG: hypothetical protein GYA34_17505 [Chloroflexi bacterium]|nr:hypothetical protein [Chloroflexota bacterium]